MQIQFKAHNLCILVKILLFAQKRNEISLNTFLIITSVSSTPDSSTIMTFLRYSEYNVIGYSIELQMYKNKICNDLKCSNWTPQLL